MSKADGVEGFIIAIKDDGYPAVLHKPGITDDEEYGWLTDEELDYACEWEHQDATGVYSATFYIEGWVDEWTGENKVESQFRDLKPLWLLKEAQERE